MYRCGSLSSSIKEGGSHHPERMVLPPFHYLSDYADSIDADRFI